MLRITRLLLILMAGLLLCACDDPEEKLEKHVSYANRLIVSGYLGAALVELDQALMINPANTQALHLLDQSLNGPQRWPRLLSALLNAYKHDLQDQALLLRLVEALHENQHNEKALRLAEKIRPNLRSEDEKRQLNLLIANCLVEQDKADQAFQLIQNTYSHDLNKSQHYAVQLAELALRLKAAELTFPFHPSHQVHLLPGAQLWNDGVRYVPEDLDQQLSWIRDQLQRIPFESTDQDILLFSQARLALLEGKPAEAAQSIDDLLTHYPNFSGAQYLLARAYYEQGYYNSAEQILLKQTQLDQTPADQRKDANLFIAIQMKKQDWLAVEESLKPYVAEKTDPEQSDQEKVKPVELDQDTLLHLTQFSLFRSHNNPISLTEARTYLDDALTRFPKSAYAHAQNALLNMQLRKPEKAIKALKESRYIAGYDPRYAQALLEAYLQMGHVTEAKSLAETLHKQFSDQPVTQHNLARIHSRTNRDDLGELSWQALVEEHPDFTSARISLATLYRQQGQLDKAAELLDRGLRLLPSDPGLNTERAILDDYAGRFNASRMRLQSVKLQHADYWQAELALGYLALRAGQINAALKTLNYLQTHVPGLPPVSLFEARVMQVLNNPTLSLTAYERLLQSQPGHPELMVGAAQVEISLGKFEKASFRLEQLAAQSHQYSSVFVDTLLELAVIKENFDDVDQAIKILIQQDKNPAVAYTLYADRLMHSEDYKKALKMYQKAVNTSPDPSILIKLTNALVKLGRTGDAIILLKQKQAQQQDITKLKMHLVDLLFESGDQHAAINSLEDLLVDHPEHIFALQKLAKIYLQRGKAESNPRRGNLSLAWDFAKRAYFVTEFSPEILAIYGELCVRRGRISEGLNVLERAVKYSPRTEHYKRLLAEAYELAGKSSDAEKLAPALSSEQTINGKGTYEPFVSL